MGTVEIPLSGRVAAGRVALVDEQDAELVAGYSWRASDRRLASGRLLTYAKAYVRGSYATGHKRDVYMHQVIAGPHFDHVNRNGLDNRRSNLRPATESQNSANASPINGKSSTYKGVTWSRDRRKWQAQIHGDGITRFLGRFASEEDAGRAYDHAATECWGDFAVLNFPMPVVK